MQVFINKDIKLNEGTAVSLGNFDGLHIGHKLLINTMKEKAKLHNLISSVFTFTNHTTRTISSNNFPNHIISNEKKIELIENLGINILYMMNFNEDVMNLSSEEFVKKYLVQQLNVKLIVVGFNYKFGFEAKGNTETLKLLGKKYGFEVIVLDPIYIEKDIISSTYIRNLIREGNIHKCNELLGRAYTIIGSVVNGKNRGRDLGFPTANIKLLDDYVIPKRGIYKTVTKVGNDVFLSVTSVGTNPTFGKNETTIETYILDFNKNIYNEVIEVSFLDYLRDEIRFNNEHELIAQIEKDVRIVRGNI